MLIYSFNVYLSSYNVIRNQINMAEEAEIITFAQLLSNIGEQNY